MNEEKSIVSKIDPNKITLTVCKKCRDVMYYFEEDLSDIPSKCEKCGGTIIITDKYETEWYEEYIKTHPGTKRSNLDIDAVYAWVAKVVTTDSEEYNPAEEQRVKDEWDDFLNEYAKPHCPKCYSTNIGKAQQGFKWGRAIGAAALTGFLDVAAVAGAVGSNKMVNCCNECGHKWK
jgi:predicted Zn-ribbon and HTH transcriptional regulator